MFFYSFTFYRLGPLRFYSINNSGLKRPTGYLISKSYISKVFCCHAKYRFPNLSVNTEFLSLFESKMRYRDVKCDLRCHVPTLSSYLDVNLAKEYVLITCTVYDVMVIAEESILL